MSSDKSDEDEETISKQIVDYYKKYSQNKHLPKYFSGTSLSYMPLIVKEDEIVTKAFPNIIVDDTNSKTLVEQQPEHLSAQPEYLTEPKPVSPASSITSNRKLEWDNGADIGYNNYSKNLQLHKSASLPILLTSNEVKNAEEPLTKKLSSQIVTVISYSSGDSTSSNKPVQASSSSSCQADVPITSSSSSVKTNTKPMTSSSSSFTNTLAYLKSKIGSPHAESTPKLTSEEQNYSETPVIRNSKNKAKSRIVNLCVTKPTLVQCFDHSKKKGFDKKVQTSLIEILCKSVQTSDSLEIVNRPSKDPVPAAVENQSVIFINYSSESDKRTCSSNTQTDAEIIASQCDSFEYYKNNAGESILKRSSPKSDLVVSTDSSKDTPLLGQLITEKQSKSVIGDVDRSIELLQKLLKSKKYDPATKKRYIKKIVGKIVDNKYNEDSTTSSELFIPKKQSDKVQQQLQENIPWRPPLLSKFSVKTFSEEFVPSESRNESKKKSIFVINQNQPENKSSTSLEKQESSGSYQSWKEDKTLSEKLLEEKQNGQGDHLVKFAMKERQHQIKWIGDEISHLTKLKGLLEKKAQTTTTVYMVSQHLDSDENSCPCSSRNPSRNYVIQTELSSSSSGDVPTDYNLYDKTGKRNYRVTDFNPKPGSSDDNRRLVGDIEVVSDDKTTNIKIKTKRVDAKDTETFKPKAPMLIGSEKYDTFPRSKTEEERCWPCGRWKTSRKLQEDERCWPCGRLKTLGKSQLNGLGSTKYSLEVPLDTYKLSNKVNEIVNAYAPGSSGLKSTCHCRCKCMEIIRQRLDNLKKTKHPLTMPMTGVCKQINIEGVKLKTTEPESSSSCTDCPKANDSERICACCRRKNQALKTGNIQCQTDECDCTTKEVQTSICNKVECTSTDQDQAQTTCQTDKCDCINKGVQTCVCSKTESTNAEREEAQMTSQTDNCNCISKGVQTCVCTKVNTERQRTQSSSETSSSTSCSESATSTSYTADSVRSCLCCKRKNVSSKRLYTLRKKLSDQAYPLCRPCYRQNRSGAYSPNFYTNPGHVCNCYTVVQTKTLNEIKETIKDLNALDQYCTCMDVDNRNSSDYCQYCKCKLKKTSKNRNGIAYMLTFENGSFREERPNKRHKKKQRLEEIKIKIPVPYKKKHKDKENKRKKAKHGCESEATSSSGVSKRSACNLQECLNKNRPQFVQFAEGRRTTINEARTQREEVADYNKMQFLKKCQEECEKNSRHIFSEKEMKEITKRNYKKLPEVQQRLNTNKERQLRQANRLMADCFNRKLRDNVLKGKRNLPTDVKVLNM